MKINELKFRTHPAGLGGTLADVKFKNGYGASVITGSMFYTNDSRPYEIAVMHSGGITYETSVADDVLGYLTEEEANQILAEIEQLKEKNEQ